MPRAAPTPCGSPVHGPFARRRALEGVQRQPDASIADRVRLDLPAAPVGLGREGVEIGWLPRRQARRRVVLVRRQHRRRLRLDHAIHEGLQDAGVQVVAPAQREGEGLVGVEAVPPLGQRLVWGHDERAAEPERQFAVRVDADPERELVGLQPGVLGRGDANGVEAGDGPTDRGPVVVLGRNGDEPLDEELRLLLEDTGGLPSASFTMMPLGGSGVSLVTPARRRAALFAQPVWPS